MLNDQYMLWSTIIFHDPPESGWLWGPFFALITLPPPPKKNPTEDKAFSFPRWSSLTFEVLLLDKTIVEPILIPKWREGILKI